MQQDDRQFTYSVISKRVHFALLAILYFVFLFITYGKVSVFWINLLSNVKYSAVKGPGEGLFIASVVVGAICLVLSYWFQRKYHLSVSKVYGLFAIDLVIFNLLIPLTVVYNNIFKTENDIESIVFISIIAGILIKSRLIDWALKKQAMLGA